MISDDLAKQLHDRRTRGESLSLNEQADLENWYALQDQNESASLDLSTSKKNNSNLQIQIENTLNQITTVTKRIQDITTENETLRREILALRRQFARNLTPELV